MSLAMEETWQSKGECGKYDPELWHPTRGRARKVSDKAIKICRSCPVIDECLQWALEHRVIDGIWGGTTSYERQVILNPNRRWK